VVRPFAGITRIRFKGSLRVRQYLSPLSGHPSVRTSLGMNACARQPDRTPQPSPANFSARSAVYGTVSSASGTYTL
jgi:hypothetical protein